MHIWERRADGSRARRTADRRAQRSSVFPAPLDSERRKSVQGARSAPEPLSPKITQQKVRNRDEEGSTTQDIYLKDIIFALSWGVNQKN